ncbi:MAG: mechanosensitive ion channel family protein [Burkholderiales bacterium]
MAEPANAAAGAAGSSSSLNFLPGQTDSTFGPAIQHINGWIDGGIRLLPNIVVGIVVFVCFFGLALLFEWLIERSSRHRNRTNLGEVAGGFVKWMTLLLAFLLAATIVIPSLKPGDLIAGLGVSSVAIGFAFKDILQNWLAGLLILFRQPFEVGDQIEVKGYEGTVKRIETRATLIQTYDGQRVVIPNSDIYTNVVVVRTAHDTRRSEYDVGIGYGDNIAEACEVIRKAMASVAEVEKDPPPEALPWDLAASWVAIRARWWTHSRRADVVHVRAKVIEAVKNALDAAGIDLPYETTVALFHDQTEAGEGDRSRQREGWPAAKVGSTEPRWKLVEQQRAQTRANEKSSGGAGPDANAGANADADAGAAPEADARSVTAPAPAPSAGSASNAGSDTDVAAKAPTPEAGTPRIG